MTAAGAPVAPAADIAALKARLAVHEELLGVLIRQLDLLTAIVERVHEDIGRIHDADRVQVKLLSEIRDAVREAAEHEAADA